MENRGPSSSDGAASADCRPSVVECKGERNWSSTTSAEAATAWPRRASRFIIGTSMREPSRRVKGASPVFDRENGSSHDALKQRAAMSTSFVPGLIDAADTKSAILPAVCSFTHAFISAETSFGLRTSILSKGAP